MDRSDPNVLSTTQVHLGTQQEKGRNKVMYVWAIVIFVSLNLGEKVGERGYFRH